jgi:hypothetical protein
MIGYGTTPACKWIDLVRLCGVKSLLKNKEYKWRYRTHADYITGDILGIPAYGEVGIIVALVSVANGHSWLDSDSRYSVIDGIEFVLDSLSSRIGCGRSILSLSRRREYHPPPPTSIGLIVEIAETYIRDVAAAIYMYLD